jgi:glucose/arabinose dehydrogenase
MIVIVFFFITTSISAHSTNENLKNEKYMENRSGFKKQVDELKSREDIQPEFIIDPKLKIEVVSQGLQYPTTMSFIGLDEFLVLEKEKGVTRIVMNGSLLKEPILNINASGPETCICGIAVIKDSKTQTSVFAYITESQVNYGENLLIEGSNSVDNRLYKYELINGLLQKGDLLLDLPSTAGPHHTGGALIVGMDNNLYLPVGDLDNIRDRKYIETKAQNVGDSKDPDGRGGILRLTQDGHTVGKGILGDSHPLNKYYAYGIRNSYGIDFDPVTGNLWDTEDGPAYGDEINLVKPGFNSGWIKIQGIWQPQHADASTNILELQQGKILPRPEQEDLVNFHGKGHYSSPEFIWNKTVGVTAIKFMTSDKLGKQYKNDLFVGDFNNGNIYHFDLTKDRTELILTGKLSDKIADNISEIDESNILFGQGFGGITDIEVNPYDGYLYIVSIVEGKIFRIVPNGNNHQN